MSGPEHAPGVVLRDAPPGSIVATRSTVALRVNRTAGPWIITDGRGGYTTGDLLAMSQEWTVLRRGWPA